MHAHHHYCCYCCSWRVNVSIQKCDQVELASYRWTSCVVICVLNFAFKHWLYFLNESEVCSWRKHSGTEFVCGLQLIFFYLARALRAMHFCVNARVTCASQIVSDILYIMLTTCVCPTSVRSIIVPIRIHTYVYIYMCCYHSVSFHVYTMTHMCGCKEQKKYTVYYYWAFKIMHDIVHLSMCSSFGSVSNRWLCLQVTSSCGR